MSYTYERRQASKLHPVPFLSMRDLLTPSLVETYALHRGLKLLEDSVRFSAIGEVNKAANQIWVSSPFSAKTNPTGASDGEKVVSGRVVVRVQFFRDHVGVDGTIEFNVLD